MVQYTWKQVQANWKFLEITSLSQQKQAQQCQRWFGRKIIMCPSSFQPNNKLHLETLSQEPKEGKGAETEDWERYNAFAEIEPSCMGACSHVC